MTLFRFSGVLSQGDDDAPVRLKWVSKKSIAGLQSTQMLRVRDGWLCHQWWPRDWEDLPSGLRSLLCRSRWVDPIFSDDPCAGGGKVYRKCGLTNEVRAECVATTTRTGDPLEACYCHVRPHALFMLLAISYYAINNVPYEQAISILDSQYSALNIKITWHSPIMQPSRVICVTPVSNWAPQSCS